MNTFKPDFVRCGAALTFVVLAVLSFVAPPASAATPLGQMPPQGPVGCQPSWVPTFGGERGMDHSVYALTDFDDGSGHALYAVGNFTTAGGVAASYIAKWNGSVWSQLGGGINSAALALTVFDDGSGPALYAGGYFTTAGGLAANHVAKWNGSVWSQLGSGTNGYVSALTVFDDGSGPALYAGGLFTTAGGVAANNVAKWNGSSWSALASGTNDLVRALTVFDDGGGPALYAGGLFTAAGGVTARCIAKWDGSSWSPVGGGMLIYMQVAQVFALTVFDDGSGPALYAGGAFETPANYIAKWDGSSWSALGVGMPHYSSIHALTAFDDGSGPALCAAGYFTSAGGVAANNIAKWNGSSWSALGDGMSNNYVWALAVFDDGSGPALHAGGDFDAAGAAPAHHIARWNGSGWAALGNTMIGSVAALTVFDDGSGPALVAGGSFTAAGDVVANRIAKWSGSSWSQLGSGMNDGVRALAVFDDGSGPALYAGGYFQIAGGLAASHLAKWDGSLWSALGGGTDGYVAALTVFDDGGGPALYAGGYFGTAGGVAANDVAKWNGSSWTALGIGIPPYGEVFALTAFDDGSGSALYVGGHFTTAGGVAANYIAKWNGSSWSAVGSGVVSIANYPGVFALAVFDDGSGSALYAGGTFETAGSVAATSIAKWNGSSWSKLGTGMSYYATVSALTVFDDGSGRALYAGGSLASAGGVLTNGIAKWNGSSWSSLGSGLNGGAYVSALTVFNDSSGPALYVGGYVFTVAQPPGDSNLAKWGCTYVSSGTTYCTAGTTSNGCVPTSCTGNASATASSGFRLSVANVEGHRPGLLFYGIDGQLAAPWGSGGTSLLCVKSRAQRMTARNSGGATGTCTGTLGEDWNTYVAGHPGALGQPFTGGETVWVQGWFRDPPSAKTTNLSNGLVFAVGP